MASKPASAFSGELLDQLLSGRDPATVLESGGLIGDLKKALAERMLNAEMDVHLDAESEVAAGNPHIGRRKSRQRPTSRCTFATYESLPGGNGMPPAKDKSTRRCPV